MSSLTLVSHYLCPYVQRVSITLDEKQVPFERVYVDLGNKPEWFLAQSPLGKTPLLKVGDEVIFESAVICEYLEEVYPRPLHPRDPLLRAKHRAWMELGSTILGDIWGYETAQDERTMLAKAADISAKLQWLEKNVSDGPFFCGDQMSFVDVVFGPIFRYFDVFERLMDHEIFRATPRTAAWRARLAARPSVRAAVTNDYPERLLAFLRNKQAYLYTHAPQERKAAFL